MTNSELHSGRWTTVRLFCSKLTVNTEILLKVLYFICSLLNKNEKYHHLLYHGKTSGSKSEVRSLKNEAFMLFLLSVLLY